MTWVPPIRARRALATVAIAAGALAAGCSSAPKAPWQVKSQFVYRCGPGDILEIEVFDETALRREVVVAPDGHITFPLAGEIRAGGRTPLEIAVAVTERLVKSGRFADPKLVNLSVTLKESRSSQVQVLGEVGRQGPVPYRERLSLVEAIGAVGGPSWATAKFEHVHIVRGALDAPAIIEVDLEDILDAEEPDIALLPGDIVVVPPKYVTVFQRYVQQVLSPITAMMGAGRQAASGAVVP